MMDFNNNGKIDVEDLLITEILLEDEDKEEEELNSKPKGNCLASMCLFIAVPIGIILIASIWAVA